MPLPTPEELAQYASAEEQTGQADQPVAAGPAPAGGEDILSPDYVARAAGILPPTQAGAAHDSWWSNLRNSGSRILNSMGAGPAQKWGALPHILTPEEESALGEFGKTVRDGHETFMKDINEALIRPSIDAAKAFGGEALSIPSQALESAAATSQQTGAEIAGRQAGATVEITPRGLLAAPFQIGGELASAASQGYVGPEFGVEAETGPRLQAEAAQNQFATQAALARSVGAVGEGEEGFYDAVPVTPENLEARQAAAAEAGIEVPPEPGQPPVDLHALARRIEPDLFTDYDAAALERETARQELAVHSEARAESAEAVDSLSELDDLLGSETRLNPEERTTRLQAMMASAPDSLVERLQGVMDRYDRAMSVDTPAMVQARNRLMDADFAMRDMAPDVADAYRRARDMAPDLPIEPELEAAGEKAEGAHPAATEEAKPAEGAAQGEEPTAEEAGRHAAPIQGLSEAEARGEAKTADVVGEKEGGGATGELPKVEGTGEEATRRVSERSEENAVANGLKDAFGDLPIYRRVNMKLQAKKAVEIVDKDPEAAREIAMGTREAPPGVIPEHVFIAVENRALAEGDFETAADLANSRLSQTGTSMGQRIRSWAERNDASPVKYIQDLQRSREAAHPDIENAKANEVDDMRSEMRNAASKPEALRNFLKGLECGE